MKYLVIIAYLIILSVQLGAQTLQQKQEFLDSLNKYRTDAGVRTLEYSFDADTLAIVRANTILEHVYPMSIDELFVSQQTFRNNLHHGFDDDFMWYNRDILHQDTTLYVAAECSGYLTQKEFLQIKDDVVSAIFKGWKNSQDHWKVMLKPEYAYISIHWTLKDWCFIPVLVLFDKKLRSPDKIKYMKYTRELRVN